MTRAQIEAVRFVIKKIRMASPGNPEAQTDADKAEAILRTIETRQRVIPTRNRSVDPLAPEASGSATPDRVTHSRRGR